MSLTTIETQCAAAAAAAQELTAALAEVQADIDRVRREAMPRLRKLRGAFDAVTAKLHREIDRHAADFHSPRTRLYHGVKVGLRSQPATVVFESEDEAALIARIDAALPQLATMLAPPKRTPNLRAIELLPDADLTAIGGSRKPQPDKLVLAFTTGDPLKTWNALVGERAAEAL
jgi:uncharacterized coiled-coil protein SlyX